MLLAASAFMVGVVVVSVFSDVIILKPLPVVFGWAVWLATQRWGRQSAE